MVHALNTLYMVHALNTLDMVHALRTLDMVHDSNVYVVSQFNDYSGIQIKNSNI